MVLPVPSEMTASVGGILTSAQWNSNVRDAVNYLTSPPLFVGSQSTAQSCANGIYTAVALDTAAVDTYGGHSTTVNNSRYVAQVAGWYLCVAAFGFNTTTGRLGGYWGPSNGSIGTSSGFFTPASSNGLVGLTVAQIVHLQVGDYVQAFAYQNSGAAANLLNVTANIVWMHA